jgi:hypothetical protein
MADKMMRAGYIRQNGQAVLNDGFVKLTWRGFANFPSLCRLMSSSVSSAALRHPLPMPMPDRFGKNFINISTMTDIVDLRDP